MPGSSSTHTSFAIRGIIAATLLLWAPGPLLAEVPDADATAIIFSGIRSAEPLRELSDVLESRVASRLEERGRVEVVSNWELGRVIDAHADRLIAGCLEACEESVDVIGALGAPILLVGRLHAVGGIYDLSLTLLDTADGRVLARAVGDAETERGLIRTAEDLSWTLLRQADLIRPGLGPSGLGEPRFHLALKAGNSLASVGTQLIQGRLHGARLNIEGNYYITPRVLAFIEIGATVGRVRDADRDGVLNLGIVPAGLGLKHLWTFERARLWAGGALGAGFLGLFLGQSADITAAFSTTFVVGADWRLSRRWVLLVEGSTALTDAIFARAEDRDLSVPLYAGLTVGAAWLIP